MNDLCPWRICISKKKKKIWWKQLTVRETCKTGGRDGLCGHCVWRAAANENGGQFRVCDSGGKRSLTQHPASTSADEVHRQHVYTCIYTHAHDVYMCIYTFVHKNADLQEHVSIISYTHVCVCISVVSVVSISVFMCMSVCVSLFVCLCQCLCQYQCLSPATTYTCVCACVC